MQMRLERDSIGVREVPAGAYYGVQTLRSAENFPITGLRLESTFIDSLAQIKRAAAQTNCAAGVLAQDKAQAICGACDEILAGKLHEAFIVDPVQGGAGTSMNMNANEVIANRANELLGGGLGTYEFVHPNDHVNLGQSTNDVIPTAGRITALRMSAAVRAALGALHDALMEKSTAFDRVLKMGRTQLQDAVPIRLGQEFHAYATTVARDIRRLETAETELETVNLGGTAIGTGVNADRRYFDHVVPCLARLTGLNLRQADDLIAATQNLDAFVALSAAVRGCAVDLSKMASDLRLMSSGPRCGFGEITLPAVQNGSSIMPGKVNPVIPEVVNQVAFNVVGNDVTISMAAEAGQLELNAFEPVIFYNLFHSLRDVANAVRTFTRNCVAGIGANERRCRTLVEQSVGIITPLCPHVGYQKAAELAKKALATGEPVRQLLQEEKILTSEQTARVLDPFAMTEPGIR